MILILNGIPLKEIMVDFSMKNYSTVNFSKLKRLKVNGHLNIYKVNNNMERAHAKNSLKRDNYFWR